jgi:hypothetical protein
MESWIHFAGITRGLRIASRLKNMSEEAKLTLDSKGTNAPRRKIIWLLLAFAPSLLSLPVVYGEWYGLSTQGLTTLATLIIVTAICCLSSGIGVLSEKKNQTVRILLGLFLAGVFFMINVFIVVLVGCGIAIITSLV